MELFWVVLSSFWTLYDAAMAMTYYYQGDSRRLSFAIAMGICWLISGIFWLREYYYQKEDKQSLVIALKDDDDLEDLMDLLKEYFDAIENGEDPDEIFDEEDE